MSYDRTEVLGAKRKGHTELEFEATGDLLNWCALEGHTSLQTLKTVKVQDKISYKTNKKTRYVITFDNSEKN